MQNIAVKKTVNIPEKEDQINFKLNNFYSC